MRNIRADVATGPGTLRREETRPDQVDLQRILDDLRPPAMEASSLDEMTVQAERLERVS